MASKKSLERAAQCWCDKRVEDRVMDPALCEVVAEALDAARLDGFEDAAIEVWNMACADHVAEALDEMAEKRKET